jgi:mercuric ion transport protein
MLLTLGISGAWIGNLTALEPYKPIFAVIALGFIAAGFRQVYFRKALVCEPGSYCARPSSARITKTALWASLILVLAALTIDWWAPLLY